MITQIGSLPYNNVNEAIDYSLRHNIPFLPELPSRGETMLKYIKNPGLLCCLAEFRSAVKGYERVKVQCVGPVTLIQSGYGRDEAITRAYEHISAILESLDVKEVILFLDEPALGQFGGDFREMWEPLFSSFKVTSGVHICGGMDWDKMFCSDIDIISFDASKYDITRYPNYRNKKRIAWGISEIEDIKDFWRGDLLTPPCGLGLKTQEECQKTLEMLLGVKADLSQS